MTHTARDAPPRADHRAAAAAAVAAAAALLVITVVWMVDRRVDGDSTALVAGAHGAISCVRDGKWTGCGEQVVHFPLLQYLLAVPAIGLGASDSTVLVILSVVNGLCLAAAFAASVVVGYRTEGWRGAWLMLAVVMTSPLVVYGGHTFREGLAAAILAGLILVIVSRGSTWAIGVLALLAGLSQETAAPFVGVLGLLAARDRGSPRLLPRPARWLPLAVGLGVAVVLNAAFNVFRYASVRNQELLDADYTVPRLSWRLVLGASLWFSPNGGIVWFWFGATVVVLAVVARGALGVVRTPHEPRRWAPNLVLGGLLLVHTAGLASWWVPWGWIAWGPRLSLPVWFGAVLVAFHLEGPWLAACVRWLLASAVRATAGIVVVIVFALPQIGALADEAPYVRAMFGRAHGECPLITPPQVFPGVDDEFFRCELVDRAWRRPSVLVDRGLSALGWPQALLVLLALGALATTTRAARRERDQPAPVRGPR